MTAVNHRRAEFEADNALTIESVQGLLRAAGCDGSTIDCVVNSMFAAYVSGERAGMKSAVEIMGAKA